jgi:hypothetical protein
VNYYELKRRLQGLICTFIISVFLIGCVQNAAYIPGSVEVFSPQFYILKKVEKSDYDRLEKLRMSKNSQTAASASLILGIYYLRYDKNIAKAEPLLVNGYAGKNLDPYMKRMGELWLMELEIAKGRNAEARGWAEKVRTEKDNAPADEALQTYCTIMRLLPSAGSGNFNCVETRLRTSAEKPSIVKPFETPKGTLNILVVGGADPQDASGGVYFYAKKYNMNHRTRLSKTYREGDWDFVVDIDNSILTGRGYTINFKPDVSGMFLNMKNLPMINGCGKIFLGYGKEMRDTAYELLNNLKNIMPAGTTYVARVTDISESGAARRIREHLSGWERTPYCAIGAGIEDEINNFTPYVKQYFLRPGSQRVFIIKPIDTGKHYSENYLPYYANTYLFPIIDFNLTPEMQDFSVKYKEFSGREITYETLIGYDMMHYIHTQTMAQGGAIDPYITNITGFDGGKAVRSVRVFYINKQGEAESVVFENIK